MRAYLRAIASVAVAVPLFALVACDETVDATKVSTTDAGTDSGPSTSLYQRVGGKDGITALVDAVVAEEVKDPEIAAFFGPNTLTPPPGGKPTVAQIKACLVLQISAAAADKSKGDPEFVYPGKLADGSYTCRDMKTSHAGLGINSAQFDKFAAIAAAVATKSGKLAETDLKSLTDFLTIQKSSIVSATSTDSGTDAPVDTDSGTDAGTDAPADAPADG